MRGKLKPIKVADMICVPAINVRMSSHLASALFVRVNIFREKSNYCILQAAIIVISMLFYTLPLLFRGFKLKMELCYLSASSYIVATQITWK